MTPTPHFLWGFSPSRLKKQQGRPRGKHTDTTLDPCLLGNVSVLWPLHLAETTGDEGGGSSADHGKSCGLFLSKAPVHTHVKQHREEPACQEHPTAWARAPELRRHQLWPVKIRVPGGACDLPKAAVAETRHYSMKTEVPFPQLVPPLTPKLLCPAQNKVYIKSRHSREQPGMEEQTEQPPEPRPAKHQQLLPFRSSPGIPHHEKPRNREPVTLSASAPDGPRSAFAVWCLPEQE